MARPKKEADARKSKRITIRLTETEYEVYKEFARRGGFTLSELIRLMMVNGKVSYPRNSTPSFVNAIPLRLLVNISNPTSFSASFNAADKLGCDI